MDIERLIERLVETGHLRGDEDIKLFRYLADHAPDLFALVYAAALADDRIWRPEDKLH